MNIHALSTGTVQIKTSHLKGRGHSRLSRAISLFGDPGWSGSLPIYVWVLEHPEGIILIDTGDSAGLPAGVQHPFHTFATRKELTPEQEVAPQLENLGIKPADVRWVVLTHLHVDHDGGIGSFPNAEFVVAAGEYRQARRLAGRVRGYLPQRWPDGWRPQLIDFNPEPFGPFGQSFRLTRAGDVVLVPTPGHTAHHLSVTLQTDGLSYFFAGDASYTEQFMLVGAVDGISPSRRAASETLGRIRNFAETQPTVYLPTHDPASGLRLEQQIVTQSSQRSLRDGFRAGQL